MSAVAHHAELNDRLRTSLEGGRVVISKGIDLLGGAAITDIFHGVMSYSHPKDDPHPDHDVGMVEVSGRTIVWNIACVRRRRHTGPQNADRIRTLNIMLEEEC